MYSQYEEEKHILEALGDILPAAGRFLDIGCWDPITFSNTRALFEKGWSGVMIEPAPGPFMELLRCCTKCGVRVDEREHETYGKRAGRDCPKCGATRYGFEPRLTLIEAAVAVEPGFVNLWLTDDALSTNDAESFAKWDKVGGFYGRALYPAITLDQIANRFGGFHFVNFDVEGSSARLFLEMLRLGWQPRCVCVETDGRDAELIAEATPRHYNVVYGNGQNLVMVRK